MRTADFAAKGYLTVIAIGYAALCAGLFGLFLR